MPSARGWAAIRFYIDPNTDSSYVKLSYLKSHNILLNDNEI